MGAAGLGDGEEGGGGEGALPAVFSARPSSSPLPHAASTSSCASAAATVTAENLRKGPLSRGGQVRPRLLSNLAQRTGFC